MMMIRFPMTFDGSILAADAQSATCLAVTRIGKASSKGIVSCYDECSRREMMQNKTLHVRSGNGLRTSGWNSRLSSS